MTINICLQPSQLSLHKFVLVTLEFCRFFFHFSFNFFYCFLSPLLFKLPLVEPPYFSLLLLIYLSIYLVFTELLLPRVVTISLTIPTLLLSALYPITLSITLPITLSIALPITLPVSTNLHSTLPRQLIERRGC